MRQGETARADWAAAGRRRRVRVNAIICAACAAILTLPIAIEDPILHTWELAAGDVLTDQRGGGKVDDRLVLVGIDDASLAEKRFDCSDTGCRWP